MASGFCLFPAARPCSQAHTNCTPFDFPPQKQTIQPDTGEFRHFSLSSSRFLLPISTPSSSSWSLAAPAATHCELKRAEDLLQHSHLLALTVSATTARHRPSSFLSPFVALACPRPRPVVRNPLPWSPSTAHLSVSRCGQPNFKSPKVHRAPGRRIVLVRDLALWARRQPSSFSSSLRAQERQERGRLFGPGRHTSTSYKQLKSRLSIN